MADNADLDTTGQDRQARRIALWAIGCSVLACVAMLGISLRVLQLKTAPSDQLQALMGDPISTRPSVGRRGDLVDCRGRLLATSTIGWRAFIDPRLIEDLGTIGVELEALIGLDAIETDQKLNRRLHSRFVPVSGILEEWQVDRINSADLAGIGLERRLVRSYPQGSTAARLVGAVGFDHQGLGGLEHALEDQLLGQSGKLKYLRDVRNRPMWVASNGYEPHVDAPPVRLTIDLAIQRYLEERLQEAVDACNAGGGRAIVIDPETGEILALSDIINKREGWPGQPEDPLRESHERLGRNRCVTDPYEPGSTFKPFVWAVATESGVASAKEVLPTPEAIPHRTTSGRRIRDVHYYGPVTWRRVLVKSLNSGMAIVAERLSEQAMQDCVQRFGFGQRTGCGIAGETAGLVTSAKAWSSYTQVSVSMGHEIAVTPLQMVRGFSAFARDGSLPSLRMVSEDDSTPIQQQAISTDMAQQVREILEEVMTEGTGRQSQSERYRLFGKSGTAQLPKVQGGGYHEDRYISSFIAGAPFNQPEVVVLCVIDDPDRSLGAWYGGRVAGPVTRDVIDFTLEYMGVAPDKLPEGMALGNNRTN